MKRLLIYALTLNVGLLAMGQNPIISSNFSADPTARVFDGRIYVYPSHDIPPVDIPTQRPDWFCMADYHVYSSENLSDWTDHGMILDQKDVPWGDGNAYSMWAPDCIKGKDGRYYFYFPDAPKPSGDNQRRGGFGVGVAISNTPYGPFKAEPTNIKGISGIDPCVLQASDGNSYIFWGGGGLREAKLKDNLLELADDTPKEKIKMGDREMEVIGLDVAKGLPEGFKEGPFAFERNGKYYLTYPWVRGKKGEPNGRGGVWENPTECLAYAMSDHPMGPWEFKGIIMEESPTGCWTNHHSIVEYKGQWYLFYHHNDYSPKFDKNRSVCCDSLFFNADGTIQLVKPTLRGVGITDAKGRVQMDRYSAKSESASIAYNDTVHPMQGWKVKLPANAWVSYGNVKVPQEDYKIWVSTPGFFGRTQLTTIDKTTLKLEVKLLANGLSELVLRNTGDKDVEVDWISLNARQPLTPSTRGGLETGSYRNLFLEAGYTQDEIDKKLQEVFDGVFTGKNKCYFPVGKDMAYISDIKNNDVRTEGMSYGMMIAVQFNKKDIFDRLWRWSKKYMQMADGPMKGYFRWSCKTNGEANAQGPASDGELYFITSLIFASNQWGNDGEINYLKEAQYILDCIQPKEVEMDVWWKDGKRLDKPEKVKRNISLIDPATGLIAFVPGSTFTDPSYHLPAFYEVWARYAEDGRASYWRECAKKSREYLHKSVHPFTGLNPDYNNYDGSLMGSRGIIGDAFRYDSWRVPMNIALDYSWSCSDREWQQNYGEKIQNFFYSQGIDTFVDQYNVDGTTPQRILKAGNYHEKLRHSIGLVATTAAASIMCSHSKSYEFIDKLWNAKHTPDADGFFDAYYDGLVRLFAFMHLSGRYRVIEKQMQLPSYLRPVGSQGFDGSKVDDQGFIRRWMLLDPINKPNSSNTVFVDSYLRKAFAEQPASVKGVKLPKDGQKEKIGIQNLTWHAYDSQLYNVKLYRMASCTGQPRYGVLFWATTVIDCPEEIKDVRLAVGSNSASMWWLNGEEAVLLSGDRRMVKDDCVSPRITLKKGRNILRGAIINGPGMSDFCVRFIDEQGQPVKNFSVTVK